MTWFAAVVWAAVGATVWAGINAFAQYLRAPSFAPGGERTRFPRDFPRAVVEIDTVLHVGERKHGGKWRRVPAGEHWTHAWAHLRNVEKSLRMQPFDRLPVDARMHLAHAVTRLVMAIERTL